MSVVIDPYEVSTSVVPAPETAIIAEIRLDIISRWSYLTNARPFDIINTIDNVREQPNNHSTIAGFLSLLHIYTYLSIYCIFLLTGENDMMLADLHTSEKELSHGYPPYLYQRY